MTKKYRVEYRHRENGTLDQVFEIVECQSKTSAVQCCKRIAEERGWWYSGLTEMEIGVNWPMLTI
jgi:hypothetical protein